MKKTLRIMLIYLTISVIAVAMSLACLNTKSYAASEIDTQYVSNNLQQLKKEILEYGSAGNINSDGNAFIKYEKDGDSFSMIYNYDEDVIDCVAIYEDRECPSAVSMKLDGLYSSTTMPTVIVTFNDNDYFSAESTCLIPKYTLNTDMHFDLLESSFDSDDTMDIQDICNEHFRLAICGWQLLLYHRTNLSMESIGFTSLCSEHNYAYNKEVKKATLSKNGIIKKGCTYCGTLKAQTVYYPKKINLSKTEFVYNGKVQKPTVTVKGSNGKTIASSNYTVKYSSGCRNVGEYKVTITFKGNYSGAKTLKYKINPKGTSLKKLTKASKAFTATWNKQKTQTTGYQIQYSTNSKFKTGNKTVTISKNKTTSRKIKSLKKNKKYYVRIRTYKTVSGKKYYSSWSKVKNVTTKK